MPLVIWIQVWSKDCTLQAKLFRDKTTLSYIYFLMYVGTENVSMRVKERGLEYKLLAREKARDWFCGCHWKQLRIKKTKKNMHKCYFDIKSCALKSSAAVLDKLVKFTSINETRPKISLCTSAEKLGASSGETAIRSCKVSKLRQGSTHHPAPTVIRPLLRGPGTPHCLT